MKKLILFTFILYSSFALQAQKKKGLKFDGKDDYVAISNTSLNSIGSGDFTFEATINGKSSEQNTHAVIFSNRQQSSNGIMFFFHGLWGGSNYKMLAVQLGGVNYLIVDNGTFNADILDGTCHHVAIIRKSDLLSFYVDGEEFGTKTIGIGKNPTVQSPATDMWIGQDQPSNSTFNGVISQVKIWNTAADINNDIGITINNTNLIGSWNLNDDIGQTVSDNSANSLDGQLGNSPNVDDNDPTWDAINCNKIRNSIKEGGLKFDGKDDYVAISNTSLNSIGSGDFTFEATVNGKSSEQNTHAVIFSNRQQSSNGIMFFFHGLWGGSNYKMLAVQLGGVNYLIVDNGTFNADILDGTCHHVAITKKSDLLSFYVDGEEFGTKTIGIGKNPTVQSPATDMWIGQDQPSNSTFNGIISQVKIWNIAKTNTDIKNDIGFDVINDNLAGSWNLNDDLGQTAIDNSANNIHGELGNSPNVDNSDPTWTSVNCDVISSLNYTSNKENGDINIYPNPAKNEIHIDFEKNSVGGNITLLNINGHSILEKKINSQYESIDLDNIPSGLYIISIEVNGIRKFEKIQITD